MSVEVALEDVHAATVAQRNALADNEAKLIARITALEREKLVLMKAITEQAAEQAAEKKAELKAVS